MQTFTRILQAIQSLPQALVKAPELTYRDGKPVSSFNQFQFWAYPELCLAQANEALSHCPPDMQRRQRAVLSATFGAAF